MDSDQAEDRKCNKVLDVSIGNGDTEMMYRLGKREQDKIRPLSVKFVRKKKKIELMRNVKHLKQAPPEFNSLSIANDVTVRQRERVRECRRKAMEELHSESQAVENNRESQNFCIMVGHEVQGCENSSGQELKTGLRVLYVNARSIINKLDEFYSTVKTDDPDVVGITKAGHTRGVLDSELEVQRYDLFRCDRPVSCKGGGVLLYIKEELQATELKLKNS